MKVFVITDVEAGWDCIVGVFSTLKKAEDFLVEERGEKRKDVEVNDCEQYYIHTSTIK